MDPAVKFLAPRRRARQGGDHRRSRLSLMVGVRLRLIALSKKARWVILMERILSMGVRITRRLLIDWIQGLMAVFNRPRPMAIMRVRTSKLDFRGVRLEVKLKDCRMVLLIGSFVVSIDR